MVICISEYAAWVQMKGRAGRRGHDLRGNVVFLGIKYARAIRIWLSDGGHSFNICESEYRYTKLRRLTTCSLPPLVSNAPLSTMTVLRLAEAFQSVEVRRRAWRYAFPYARPLRLLHMLNARCRPRRRRARSRTRWRRHRR